MARSRVDLGPKRKLLTEIRDDVDHDLGEWQKIRDEANKDMRCVGGDPWGALDPRGLQQRKDAMRPHLALDELNQYINQASNDWLMNPRAIEFNPVGDGANDKTAALYADLTRDIEDQSHAQVAYSTAYLSMLQRSFGWLRIRATRESSRSFNKVLRIEPIPNPDVVIPDSDAMLPDQSDQKRLTALRSFTHKQFKRQFPKAAIRSFGTEYQDLAPTWVKSDAVQVAEHWRVRTRERTLLMLADGKGTTLFADELPKLMQQAGLRRKPAIEQEDTVDDPYVTSYLTNGIEILEEAEWPGKDIPFVSCFGNVMFFDTGAGVERRLMSMTRLARDPYMLYCYYRSTEAEVVGMTPKFPYFVYEGQLSPTELKKLADSLHQPIAVIQVKPVLDTGNPTQLIPFPQRNPYEPPIGPLEMGAEAARRAIQAAMGVTPLPTPAQRNNEKTGAAFERIESSMQKGVFHFVDHGEYMVRRTGVLLEDLIGKFYDSIRMVGLMDAIGKASRVQINVPGGLYQTKGDHSVTVKAGPSYDSSRERAEAFVDGMVKAPMLAQTIGPQKYNSLLSMSIRLMNLGPLGDKLAGIIDPQGENDPLALAQQNAQLKQQLQQYSQQLQKAMSDLNADTVKVKGRLAEKQMDAQIRITIQRMDDATQILVAKIEAAVKTGIAAQDSKDHALALGIETVRELRLSDKEHAHEQAMSSTDHREAIQQTVASHLAQIQQIGAEHRGAVDKIIADAIMNAPGNGNGSSENAAGS